MSAGPDDNRVHPIRLPGLDAHAMDTPNPPGDCTVLNEVEVVLSVRLGSAQLRLKELLALTSGDVLTLDTALDGDVTVLVDGHLVALGALIARERRFGVLITATAEN